MAMHTHSKKYRGLFLLVGALALLSLPVVAQEAEEEKPTTGTVDGLLLFYDGLPFADATIVFKAEKEEVEFETQVYTDENGKFLVENLPDKTRYTVFIRMDKQDLYELRQVRVKAGETTELIVDLKAEAKKQGQVLTEEEAAEFRKNLEDRKKGKMMKVRFDQGVAFLKQEQFSQAVTEFEAAARMDSTQVVIFANLARAYSGAGLPEQGIGAYQKAIELKPDDGGLHNNMGQLYLKTGNIEKAMESFAKAAEISPEMAGMFYYNIGVTLYNANRLKDAIEPFKKTVEVEPQRAEAHFFLGMCMFQNADWVNMKPLPGTVEALETYLKLEPKGRFAADAKQTIESIQTTFKQ
jgi:Tfp pilus assembly protein PilF